MHESATFLHYYAFILGYNQYPAAAAPQVSRRVCITVSHAVHHARMHAPLLKIIVCKVSAGLGVQFSVQAACITYILLFTQAQDRGSAQHQLAYKITL